jgi:zinc protease
MGLGNFDSVELGKALTGKVAGISAFIGEISEGIRGSASPRDLETAFQLLYLHFTGARRDEKAFASFLSTMRGRLENQEASPEYTFAKAMNEVMTQDHPRRRFATVDDLDELQLDAMLAFHKERFADASDWIFTLVGAFDPAEIRPLVETWIGGLPAPRRNETWRDTGVEEPEGIQRVTVEKGIEPRSAVRIAFHGDAPWSLDEAHRIEALGEVLRIRLREALREDMGGVYGVGVSAGLSRIPDQEYSVSIGFSSDPERVDELVAAVFAEIEALKSAGPSEDHMARVREIETRELETDVKQNAHWAFWLEHLAANDLPLTEMENIDDRIGTIGRESIRTAARRYLDTTRYVIGVLKPE